MSDKQCTILDRTNVNEVPITNDKYEKILSLQHEVISLKAEEADTQDILDKLCLMVEKLLPNAVASLMFKDERSGLLYVQAAPNIPQRGWQALNGIKPGPNAGSCGNAIYHGKSQYIINSFEDRRGTEFLDTAKSFNLCSCWSTPVKNERGETIGSFALSSFEHRSPTPFHKKLLETASSLVTITLKNEENRLKIEKMTFEDSLTSLKNKTSLLEDLKTKEFRTLLFLDINNFSYVNSAYGFEIGDKILIQTAKILENMFSEKLYHINADQFALKFDEKIDMKEIYLKIKLYFAATYIRVNSINIKVSFTYGGVYSNNNLLKDVSLAIKKAKELGKNRLYIFNAQTDDSQLRIEFINMNSLLYSAFENNFIVPYFQGIYDNSQKKITKYESLARIVTKKGEILSPYKFLNVAKLSGLLPQLTQTMIKRTFAIMSQNSCNFSINITEDDLSSNYLLEYLNKYTKEYSIEPSRVTLEILEGISATGQKHNIKQLKEFKESRYKLAIDDFGAEYSNFERVLALDVDFLKIDARYIKNIDTNKKSYEIVKAIVGFANNMNIPIIAEFVHNASVQKIVNELGISYSQGYFFSEPSASIETSPNNS